MNSDVPSRDAIVATARESIARGSKSFALASRLFDRATRERAWLLYAWCRACDDLADGQDHGGTLHAVEDAPARIALIRGLTDRALGGEWVGRAAFDGLRLLRAEVPIPRDMIDDHIAGFALDAEGWRPQTEADLLRYCHHVAGVVGRMMALVMGVAPGDADTLERAGHLGLAFQLANIARDVGEDAAAGRYYLPRDWPGTDEDLARLADMAGAYEASARIGARRLPFRSRWAVLAAAGIYGDIARAVARLGSDAIDKRVVIGRAAKLAWVVRALAQAL